MSPTTELRPILIWKIRNKLFVKNYLWFDLGYTLLYLNREKAYQQALAELDINLPLETIERGFHFMDKLFMREYPGLFGGAPGIYMPWFLGRLNYQLGIK
ncbi:hypothetical protein HNV12_28810, partial [Methanococcoides sp. SA1]|nr:hypothetical protein [Methanococcoides sp. SA1]